MIRSNHSFALLLPTMGLVIAAVACGPSLPRTSSEMANGSVYIPLSPKPVVLTPAGYKSEDVLNALPNLTMRVSTGITDNTTSLSYGAGAVGQEGHSYTVIVDYLMYTTAYLPTCYTWSDQSDKGKFVAGETMETLWTVAGRVEDRTDTRAPGIKSPGGAGLRNSSTSIQMRIPVYLGVGLRIQANVLVVKGKVQLSLFGLGTAAEAGHVSGALVFQTLGISGSAISPLIPLPADINQGSIQAAMQALAAIKAKLYDPTGVNVDLQVVGYEATLRSLNAVRLIDGTLAGAEPTAKFEHGKIRPDLISKVGENPECPSNAELCSGTSPGNPCAGAESEPGKKLTPQ